MSEQRWKGTRVPSCWDGGHLSPTSKILGACLYTHLWGTHYNGNLIVQFFFFACLANKGEIGWHFDRLVAQGAQVGTWGHSSSDASDDSVDGNAVCFQS